MEECPVDPMRMRVDSIMKLDQKSKKSQKSQMTLNYHGLVVIDPAIPKRLHILPSGVVQHAAFSGKKKNRKVAINSDPRRFSFCLDRRAPLIIHS